MKKILLNLIGLLLSFGLFSQVEINQNLPKPTTIATVKSGGDFVASLSYVVFSSGDTSYTIIFDNKEYNNNNGLQTIRFIASSSEIESIYQALKNVAKTRESISLKLGETQVTVTYSKKFGIVLGTDKGMFMIKEKQLAKLFGKKKESLNDYQ